jgi:putative oxidoreductase
VGKLPPSEGFISGTANLGFPLPTVFAWAAAMSEFLGGIFLALGLFTRVAGSFICFTMLTAVLGVHAAEPFQKKELALMYLAVAGAFMFKGAGEWSVDAFLRK